MKIFDVLRVTALSWLGIVLMPSDRKAQRKRQKKTAKDYQRINRAQAKRNRKQRRRTNEQRNQNAA